VTSLRYGTEVPKGGRKKGRKLQLSFSFHTKEKRERKKEKARLLDHALREYPQEEGGERLAPSRRTSPAAGKKEEEKKLKKKGGKGPSPIV